MNSPAQAIAWQIGRPSRWIIAAELAYLLMAAAVSPLLPAIVSRTPLGAADIPTAVRYLCSPLALIVAHWIGAFALASADGKHISFPSHMFVLPVRSRTLVLWPALYGCAALGFLWWFIAFLILRPAGIAAPLWWPAAALAALLTMIQALSWTPFTQNWLRLVLAGPVLALLGGVVLLVLVQVPEWVIAGVLLVLVGLSLAVSEMSVSLGRRGDSIDWRLASRVLEWATICRSSSSQPFASAAAAQLWFEWRGHGWLLPVFTFCVLLWLAGALLLHLDNVMFSWRMLGLAFVVPPIIAGLIGGSLGRQDAWSKYEMTSFLGTRPVATAALVRAKVVTAALSTAVTWLLVLAFAGLVLLRPGFLTSLREVVQAVGPGKALAIGSAFLAAAIVCTWLSLVQNLWLGLTGRPWIQFCFGVLMGVMIFAGSGIGFWIHLHPAWQPTVRSAVPWLLAALLLGKLIVAAIVLSALSRSRLVARSSLAAGIGLWSVIVAGLCLAAYRFVPGELLGVAQAAGGIALAIPFSRLAGAPLALAWNRHR